MKIAKQSATVLGIIIFSFFACTNEQEPVSGTKTPVSMVIDQNDLVARGEYLVNVIGCDDCHSPKIMTANGPVPDMSRRLSGYPEGNKLPAVHPAMAHSVSQGQWALFSGDMTVAEGPWGTSFASNITPDDTGIGLWTEEQFVRSMREGYYKGLEGSRLLQPPMPWQAYRNLSDEDVSAIFAYLRTIKPVRNIVPDLIPPTSRLASVTKTGEMQASR